MSDTDPPPAPSTREHIAWLLVVLIALVVIGEFLVPTYTARPAIIAALGGILTTLLVLNSSGRG